MQRRLFRGGDKWIEQGSRMNRTVVDLLIFCHSEKLLAFSVVEEKGYIVDLPRTEVVLFVAMIGPHAQVLDGSKDVVDFQEKLGHLDVLTASEHVSTLDESRRVNVACDVGR